MPNSSRPALQRAAAAALGIRLDEPDRSTAYWPSDHPHQPAPQPDDAPPAYTAAPEDGYVETEPSVPEWLRAHAQPSRAGTVAFIRRLFPFLAWIGAYNRTWLIGDVVAGVTVGAVVIPQSMAYAKLANLPPEFGLYSSFVGVLIYWFFATSKDITIGPVAVMSVVTGSVVNRAQEQLPDVPPHVVASALAVISGAIVFVFGFIRLGWIVEVISLPAISAFMTGSAISIAAGQVPKLLGVSGVDSRAATYRVIINTLKNLPSANSNAAVGLITLFLLYAIRTGCNVAARRWPARAKILFFSSTLRTAFLILLSVLVSWLVNRKHRDSPRFSILGTIPRGFKHAAVPNLSTRVVSTLAPELPASVIVLLIEHISIAKSFGRINNYTIDPSQELVAIGFTNIFGPFLGGYPATGSFSRTAIKSKAGVRTPFAGLITAIIILISIYGLPALFFYIPDAALSAVIIHAVGDLITPPNTLYRFWRISPIELPVFAAGVLVTVFSSIENGIYTSVGMTMAILLVRIFMAHGRFLGPVLIHSVLGGGLKQAVLPAPDHHHRRHHQTNPPAGRPDSPSLPLISSRAAFLPLDHRDGSNPSVPITSPGPGVFIYRFTDGYNYPNSNRQLDHLLEHIFAATRRTTPLDVSRPGDRPWNNPGPYRWWNRKPEKPADNPDEPAKPLLKALILDFSAVNNVDITSVQHLIDVRNQLEHYTAPAAADWHFACVANRWTKRALAAAGFGLPSSAAPISGDDVEGRRWKPIFSVADPSASALRPLSSAAADIEAGAAAPPLPPSPGTSSSRAVSAGQSPSDDGKSDKGAEADEEGGLEKDGVAERPYRRVALLHGINRPLFHVDLTAAVQAAIANIDQEQD